MTYSALLTQIADWLNRDDLTDTVPDFVSLAEARFNRALIVPEREAIDTVTVTNGTGTLPMNYWGMRALYSTSTTAPTLKQMSLVELKHTYTGAGAGVPLHFCVRGTDILVGPVPADDTDLVVDYYETIPALSDSNTTNWLLTAYPDLYLAGSLVEAYLFLRDTEGATLWDSRTEAKIREIEKAGRRKTTGAAPLAPLGAFRTIPRVRA